MTTELEEMKNKYIRWLWFSLLGQIAYGTSAFFLMTYVNDNFRWMVILLLPGVVINLWLDHKADKEQERIKRENDHRT